MSKAQFPHDMELNRLKKRRRFLKRSIRRAKLRYFRLKARGATKRRLGRVKAFITKRRKQLKHIEFEIGRRRRTLRERLRIKKSGFVYVNGHLVCGWIAEELVKARRYGWKGYVISGYRTPEYSRQLCQNMCGRDSCPGRCAGVHTNHAKGPHYPDGAVDLTDAYTLAQICHQHNLRIKHTLPYDAPHHSHTGQ